LKFLIEHRLPRAFANDVAE